jgi:hypothetical protein
MAEKSYRLMDYVKSRHKDSLRNRRTEYAGKSVKAIRNTVQDVSQGGKRHPIADVTFDTEPTVTVRDPDKPLLPEALRTPELHDFSDLRSSHNRLPGSLAAGVIIVLALLVWQFSIHRTGAESDAMATRSDAQLVDR